MCLNIYFNFGLKASPDMAVTLLEIARIFATKVPGKVDADVLQLLWKVSFYICQPEFSSWYVSATHGVLKC